MSTDKWEAMARALAKALRDDMTGPDRAETKVSLATLGALEAIEKYDGLDMDDLDIAIEKLADNLDEAQSQVKRASTACSDAQQAVDDVKVALDDVRRKRGLIK